MNYLIEKLKASKPSKRQCIMKEISSYVTHASHSDVQTLVEYITITNDIDLLLKLYTILSACIISDPSLRDSVIKCYIVYDKVNNILSLGQSSKITIALKFLIALLYTDEDDSLSINQSVANHARNIIRVSGCLRTIIHFFTNNMMYADTWQDTCQFIVECCRGSDINQNHCSHLIHICIKKCKEGDFLMLSVLQALIQGHKRNCKIFMDCDGLSICTRLILCKSECVHLLATLVQDEPNAAEQLRASPVPAQLESLLRTHGSDTELGQWCTVFLYYIHGRVKVLHQDEELTRNEDDIPTYPETDIAPEPKKPIDNLNETAKLMNNIIREYYMFKSNNTQNIQRPFHKNMVNDILKENNRPVSSYTSNYLNAESSFQQAYQAQRQKKDNTMTSIRTDHLKGKNNSHVTLSSLLNDFKRKSISNKQNEASTQYIKGAMSNSKIRDEFIVDNENVNTNGTCYEDKICQTSYNKSTVSNSSMNYNLGDFQDFKPVGTSTPKPGINRNYNSVNVTKNHKDDSLKRNAREYSQLSRHYMIRDRVQRRKRLERKQYKQQSQTNVAQNSSMSTRLYRVFNETCTTVVNTLKDIIMPKNNSTTNKTVEKTREEIFCNFTFTKYMKKRDALLKSAEESGKMYGTKNTRYSLSISRQSVDFKCISCNDTILLRKKLADNQYLMETVKKIKTGLYLYGCNFKKMSATMWPNEAYMTPTVLYNLYRKLILK